MPGDFVIMPFAFSDGTCEFCHEGLQTACIHGGFFGNEEVPGAQAEAVRIPQADGTLFVLPTFKEIFADFNSELPKITSMMFAISTFMRNCWYVILALPFFGPVTIRTRTSVPVHR